MKNAQKRTNQLMKSFLSILLSVILLFSVCRIDIQASAIPVISSENVRQNEYSIDMLGIESVSEVPAGFTGIYTVADLNGIRDNLSGQYILMNDITFSTEDFSEFGSYYNSGNGWDPIGSVDAPFTGTLDGNGYSVKNLYIDAVLTNTKDYTGSLSDYIGLFGYSTGSIADLGVVGQIDVSASSYRSYIGGIAAYSFGTIDGCFSDIEFHVTTDVSKKTYVDSFAYIGGIVGWTDGSITDCVNVSLLDITQKVIQSADTSRIYAGGITGVGGHDITDCTNYGKIKSDMETGGNHVATDAYLGGIAGYCNEQGTMSGCANNGDLSFIDLKSVPDATAAVWIGGCVGYSGGDIENSSNSAAIKVKAQKIFAAGIAGQSIANITLCRNTGDIESHLDDDSIDSSILRSGSIAGISGSASGVVSQCYNVGNIVSETTDAYFIIYVGGIVGVSTSIISESFNRGSVIGRSLNGSTGGIVGYTHLGNDSVYVSVFDCYNSSIVSNRYGDVGAIAGYTTKRTPNCYYIGFANVAGVGDGMDLTTECEYDELCNQETFEDFDFTDVWTMETGSSCGLPILKNNPYTGKAENTSDFGGGRGYLWDPYIITTKSHLNHVRLYDGCYFRLDADIIFDEADFSEAGEFFNEGSGWEPIDKDSICFDGNGHVIKNLYQKSDHYNSGLFGDINNSEIKNLGVLDSTMISKRYYPDGSLASDGRAGIIVSQLRSGGVVSNCFTVNGILCGGFEVGAIVAFNSGTIHDCYCINGNGMLWGSAHIGGIAGTNYSEIRNCYVIGGNMEGHSAIYVPMCGAICGLVPESNIESLMENCYYLSAEYPTGVARVEGEQNVTTTGCSHEEMMSQETYQGFDFENTWMMCNDEYYQYPVLRIFANNPNIVFDTYHEHEFEAKITKQATHLETGIKTHECSLCGLTITEDTPKNPNHVGTYTCISETNHILACECGITLNEAHNFNQTLSKPATCTEYAVITYSCVCGMTKEVEATYAPLGHEFDSNGVCHHCNFIEETGEYIKFSSATVVIGADYSLLFSVKKTLLDSDDVSWYYVVLSDGDHSESYRDCYSSESGDYYRFRFNRINPSMIGNEITADLYVQYRDGEYHSTITYSIQQYCYDILRVYAAKETLTAREAAFREVVINLLNYGSSVQKYVAGHDMDAESLVNNDLAENDKIIAVPECMNAISVGTGVDNPTARISSATALLGNSVSFRFFVTVVGEVDLNHMKAVVSIEGETPYEILGSSFTNNGDSYIFEVRKLNFISLDKAVTVQLMEEETAVSNTLTLTVASYARYHQESTVYGFADVVNSMMNFGRSVVVYASKVK